MSAQVSPNVWWFAIGEAHKGDARYLLELLLMPTATDSHDDPLPGAWVALPEEGTLRAAIVDMLVFGPWRTSDGASSIDDLMTRTFGAGKPTLSAFAVAGAAAAVDVGAADFHGLGAALGVTGETLRKRAAKHKKR